MSQAMHTPKTRRLWILSALSTLGAIAFTCKSKLTESAESARIEAEERARRAMQEKLKKQERLQEEKKRVLLEISERAKTLVDESAAADLKVLEDTRAALERDLNNIHHEAMESASEIAAHLSEFKEIAKITILLAKDQIKGSHQAATYLGEALSPVTKLIARAEGCTRSALESLQHNLNRRSNELSATLLENVEQMKSSIDAELSTTHENLTSIIKGIQLQQASLSLELLLAPLEYTGLVALRRLLQHVLGALVRRAVATTSINVALAASDGPLLIGDLIALSVDVAFLAWASYDIYKLSKELPEQIKRQIVESLDAQRSNALAAFDSQSAQFLSALHQERNRAFEPLLNPDLR